MNIVPLLGHGTARSAVSGYNGQSLKKEEQKKLLYETEKALDEGAYGISSGLEYPPGCFADISEITELCIKVHGRDGVYTTHMRNEGELLLDAINEALEVARRSGVKLICVQYFSLHFFWRLPCSSSLFFTICLISSL